MTSASPAVTIGSEWATPGREAAQYRTDIQGLRAVAVLLVLAYHAGVPFVPGGYVGVDVFFVISGFLITGLILREIETTGRLSLSRFYARRVRRLLPATAVVFVGVAVLTVTALPVTRWAGIAGDLVASTLYVVNWRLADRSVDYLAEGTAASPLQHFWSLAVEEQFYVIWPLLIAALAWSARQGLTRPRLTVALTVIAVPSFIWSVHLTAASPGEAYFVTTTRLWELAIGAFLALGAQQVAAIPRAVQVALGWVGLSAIVLAAATYTSETPFPGAAALLPTLGTAAVLAAGAGDASARLRLLDWSPMQILGTLSYSLYLWHWPLLVVAAAVWGRADGSLRLLTAVAVVGLSFVPAWLTHRFVEAPLHRSASFTTPWRAGVAGLVCMAVGLGSAAGLHLARGAALDVPVARHQEPRGAAALGDDPRHGSAGAVVDTASPLLPAPAAAAVDIADVYPDGCHQGTASDEPLSCVYGDTESSTVIALVGDSHAAQWQPALREIAEQNGWRLETYTKSGCFFGATPVWLDLEDRPYSSCNGWHDNVIDRLASATPDVVLTSVSGSYRAVAEGRPMSRPAADASLADGLARTWRALGKSGATVIVLVDTPFFGIDVPECVAENPDNLSACAVPRSEALSASAAPLQATALEQTPRVQVIDLNDYICPKERCAAVVGNVLVMRDSHHLTATYVRSLAPRLAEALHEAGLEEVGAPGR